jgi:gas vesicle protein
MESKGTAASTVFLAALGGAILGAGIALLYAPQSGRRTRRKLGELGEEAGDYARDLLEDAAEGVESVKLRGEAWARETQKAFDDIKQQAAAAMDGSKAGR